MFDDASHPLDNLPLKTSKAEAKQTLAKAVRKKLISSPRFRQVTQWVKQARHFAEDMKPIKPSMSHDFNQHVRSKVSSTLIVVVFILSTKPHSVSLSACHQFNLRGRNFQKSSKKNNKTQPELKSPIKRSKEVFGKLPKRLHLVVPIATKTSQKPPNFSHNNIDSDLNLQAFSFSPVASFSPNFVNQTRIAVTAIAPQQKKHLCINRENF